MDKTNNYSISQQLPPYNTLNYSTQNYQTNPKSTFTKVDPSVRINQQSNFNLNQRNPTLNSPGSSYKESPVAQQSLQKQQDNNNVIGNGTGRSTYGTGDEKYKNKYSFKKNTVLKSALVADAKTVQAQQLATFQVKQQKIQNTPVVLQRQQKIPNLSTNTLGQITNQPNAFFTPRPSSNTINNIQSTFIPTPINIVIQPSPVRPVVNPIAPKPIVTPGITKPFVIPPPPQPIIPSPQPAILPYQPQPIIKPSQPQPLPITPSQPVISPFVPQPKASVVNPQPLPVTPTIIPEFVDKSQQYIKQIRELRMKVEQLQSQKHQLVDQVRYYERQRFENSSQETLRVYKEQIQHLKQRIAQINLAVTPSTPNIAKNDREIQQLKEKLAASINREKEYESQLIEAQNHIIYLQNISKSKPSVSHEGFENQIKTLRETIANYNQHLQHVQFEKQQYQKYIASKEQEVSRLHQQNNALNAYLQQTKTNSSQNGIDPNQYYSLLAQFGKKDLQVIMLMQEINRLQKQYQEIRGFLERAEDFILELQKNQEKGTVINPPQNVANSKELQLALQKERQNAAVLKKSYQIEITKLTNAASELSKQSNVYLTQINNYKANIQAFNVKISELNQNIVLYQTQINNYKTEILKITSLNTQLTQQINVYKTEINKYSTQISQITQHKTTTQQGVNQQTYNALLVDFGKKQLQVIFLLEEINRLNASKADLVNHLQQAQDYIFNAQQHIKSLELKLSSLPTVNTTEAETYKLKAKDLQGKLAQANQKISTIEAKQAIHLKQIQGLELKYKGIISQLDKNYNQVLSEKNQLTQKIKTLSTNNTKVAASNISSQKSLELQQINKKLNIQLAQLTEHLVNAESFIKINSQKWEKTHLVQKELADKLDILGLLNKEIQFTKDQNVQLNDRNIQLQKIIDGLQNSQVNSQNMTIVIREKQEIEVLQSDRHAQIQQLQLSLKNYIDLYNESQAKLKLAEQQVEGYKQQIKKFADLEGYLKKTEQFITQQELKWNTDLKNYETENSQIKNHLMGAEIYIKELQQKYTKLNSTYVKIEQQNKLHIKENNDIHSALDRAEQHIYELEKLVTLRKP